MKTTNPYDKLMSELITATDNASKACADLKNILEKISEVSQITHKMDQWANYDPDKPQDKSERT